MANNMARGPKALPRSRSTAGQDDESIYRAADALPVGAAPRIRVFNIAPAPTGPVVPPGGGGATPSASAGPIPTAGPGTPHGGPASLPPKVARARSHGDSSQIESILNPVRGPRDAQVRAGIKPTDHSRANRVAVKDQSHMNALRKQAAEEESSRLKLPQVAGGMRSSSAPTRRPQLLRSNSDAGNSRNFLHENILGAGAAPVRPPRPEGGIGGRGGEDDGLKYLQKRDFGRVPLYLLERKLEMAEQVEAQLRAKEAAKIPPGMRVMPEEERLETLAILAKNRGEVERALQCLPIRIETPSQIRRKEDLERRLREIEDAQKVFSRPKVLVHA